MTHLVNDLDDAVRDAVDGLVRAAGGRLARLDGYPDIKVVVRADWDAGRVALVSGGGAGHEPAHAGFVGRGLLTAAVCGEIFASPSIDAVLAAILAVTGESGCLVIVKNYTGDRLNFGLAVERARALGRQVEMVVVADDVALPDTPQPRGLAGTLFIHKIAGALAEAGASLADVAAAARAAAANVKTIGVSLSAVAIPGRPSDDRVQEGTAELGLGIHGEPGAQTIKVENSRAVVAMMTEALQEALPPDLSGARVALLVNNLGGIAALELGIVLRDILASPLGERAAQVVGPAALMTSLSAQGFSISALPLDDERSSLLRASAEPNAAWPGVSAPGQVATAAVPDVASPSFVASHDDAVLSMLQRICAGVIQAEAELNALDAQVGDGDTGSTFATAARRIEQRLDALPLADLPALLRALSGVLASSMGGSSGVLGSLFLAAAATAVDQDAPVGQALAVGVEALQRYGGAAVGDRTLLDALVPAVAELTRGGSLEEAADAARRGAEGTAAMSAARAGRSAYVPAEHLTNVQDPGAAAVAIIFGAASARAA